MIITYILLLTILGETVLQHKNATLQVISEIYTCLANVPILWGFFPRQLGGKNL